MFILDLEEFKANVQTVSTEKDMTVYIGYHTNYYNIDM